MSTIKSSNEHLTLNADGSSKDIKFQANGVEKASISSAGVLSSAGGFTHADSVKAKFGTDNDLEIYHSGSHAYITNTTGDLIINDAGGDITIQAKTGENSIVARDDGGVELYHNDVKKIETTAAGVNVTGVLNTTGGAASQIVNGADLSVNSLGLVGTNTKSIEEVYSIPATISSSGNIIVDVDFVSSSAACTFIEISLFAYEGKYISYKHGAYWGTNWSGPHGATVVENNLASGMAVAFDSSPTAGHIKYTITTTGLTYPILRVKAMGGGTTPSTNPTITFTYNT